MNWLIASRIVTSLTSPASLAIGTLEFPPLGVEAVIFPFDHGPQYACHHPLAKRRVLGLHARVIIRKIYHVDRTGHSRNRPDLTC